MTKRLMSIRYICIYLSKTAKTPTDISLGRYNIIMFDHMLGFQSVTLSSSVGKYIYSSTVLLSTSLQFLMYTQGISIFCHFTLKLLLFRLLFY